MKARPVLYIFAGLPGSGKSTLARAVSTQLNACYLRIDTIEQALRDHCAYEVEGEGYQLAYRIAADNLREGLSVVADSCNPIELTRKEWEDVAKQENADYVNIEVRCTDPVLHKERVEKRTTEVPGLKLPSWQQVMDREYHEWTRERIVIDTAGKSAEENSQALLNLLRTRASI
jgi:predicted kinase